VGKVVVPLKVDNLADLYAVERGFIPPEACRSLEVGEALVDTGASGLSLPLSLIRQLGLTPFRRRNARTSAGNFEVQVFSAVKLSVQGRECICDVTELPDTCPALVGQLPLEMLDFVVDPVGHRLIGNPAHGGEHILELL
jgi:predicted aspartyl protease